MINPMATKTVYKYLVVVVFAQKYYIPLSLLSGKHTKDCSLREGFSQHNRKINNNNNIRPPIKNIYSYATEVEFTAINIQRRCTKAFFSHK